MESKQLREEFLKFFKERGHAIIPSAALPTWSDSTSLFAGSGMQPLIPYLLGEKHPLGTRLCDSQKCFRADDIEEVGDNRHTTFFEMLGNWSLGDYFKEEQLSWFFEFLTERVGLDPNRLYVSVFSGDAKNNIPKDEEAVAIWKRLFGRKGIEAKEGERILYYNARKNWWSRAGAPENMPMGEPGGPDSEVFYDFGTPHDTKFGPECHPNCDCGRFLEIGNSVFMEYRKREDGSFEKLAQRNVDFGGGLERICAASNGDPDVFKIDVLTPVIQILEASSGVSYNDSVLQKSFRIVADHLRASLFIIADGMLPSNTDRGYLLRRLIRRTVPHLDKLNATGETVREIFETFSAMYVEQYPEVSMSRGRLLITILTEINNFRETLERGLKVIKNVPLDWLDTTQSVPQSNPNRLGLSAIYQTYGFPFELAIEEIEKRKKLTDEQKKVLKEDFNREMEKHKEISRAGVEKKFRGGLADSKEETVRLHTAHHLFLAALRQVLGEHVHQRGSNITAERLRIDFSHPAKMTPEELKQVEDLVNQKIQEHLDMIRKEMPKEEAMRLGAEMEFGVKYGDMVSVYVAQDQQGNVFSKEFCGGPHVTNTSELGHFKILKEESVSAGIRRIRAVLD